LSPMKQANQRKKIYQIAGLLAFFTLIFVISITFLNPSSVGNESFAWNINLWAVIWALNFIIVVVLLFILARNIIKLFFEYQANRPGSRIKGKLVLTLIIFSLFPALIMALMFSGLINRNLRQWFSSPSEQLLHSSRIIADRYYEQREAFAVAGARFLATQLRTGDMSIEPIPDLLLEQLDFRGLAVFDREGVQVHGRNWPEEAAFNRAIEEGLARAFNGAVFYYIQQQGRSTIEDQGLVGVPVYTPNLETQGVLFAYFIVPDSIAFNAIQAETAVRSYEQIRRDIGRFQFSYFSILVLTTLGIIVGFVWLGTYIAKRITVPLEALAEGSRELAGGNLDYRVDVKAVDELGILVGSFNKMAGEIRQSRQQLEKANVDLRESYVRLDERRRYIETILQNIATGVISIDESEIVRTVNEAALKMLQMSRDELINRSLSQVLEQDLYPEFQSMKKRAGLYGAYRRELTFKRGDRQRHIAATMTINPPPEGDQAQYIIVLDDLTELIKAEKFAAWQEVARRLAHEIKNPLTPIQLSAERVKKRFEKILAASSSRAELDQFALVLNEATRIIIAESEMLRSLVMEFSRFARLPISKPVPVDLHELILQTLALYDGIFRNISVEKNFDSRINRVLMDPEQMQRVFVNLIDNSLDALADRDSGRRISISTCLNESRGSIRVEVEDNGTGIQPQDHEHLFLPYFSTKKKGTGLGLAIVRQIVSEHNGFVRAESVEPHGTRFVLELPVV
jgi:two-component system, NtrC family, nitrogen regulation sensor histidine kinase NtrY